MKTHLKNQTELPVVVLLTLVLFLAAPLLVVVGTLLYVASVAGLNLILLRESTQALGHWGKRAD
jgi:hypothetical protein